MTGKRWYKVAVSALACALLITLTGCEDIEDMLWMYGLDWVELNEGKVARNTLTGSTGDAETDAALQIEGLIKTIDKADRTMEQAKKERNSIYAVDAVAMRPGDWTYRISAGAILLEEGATRVAQEQFDAADTLVAQRDQLPAFLKYANQGIAELQEAEPRLIQKGWNDEAHCRAFYEQLAYFYQVRFKLTHAEADDQAMKRYTELAQQCGT
jgi:hypothetical protein